MRTNEESNKDIRLNFPECCQMGQTLGEGRRSQCPKRRDKVEKVEETCVKKNRRIIKENN